jgi:hypothetical protein
MRSISLPERRATRPWVEIDPRAGAPSDPRRLRGDDSVAELVRWARFVDPGPDASDARRAAAVQALIEGLDEPHALHDAWTTSLRMLARGEVTRSVVGLLADAMGSHEVAVSA